MTAARHHAEWLSLVETSGPFLSLPVLLKVFPQGLSAHDPEHFAVLKQAYAEWENNVGARRPDPGLHREWVRFVLRHTLALPDEVLVEGPAIPASLTAEIRTQGETLRPTMAVMDPPSPSSPARARLLVQVVPASQDLEKQTAGSRWIASPATRMTELLRGTGVPLGLVTNGEHWMLVSALRDTSGEAITSGYASWYAALWTEEPITLRAFRDLLGCDRFFAVPEAETLEVLLRESAANQQEVTDQLGFQVRKAVEVLIQALDRIDRNVDRKLLEGVDEKTLYEAALTVMMRLVFLFSAEERDLLTAPGDAYDRHYAVTPLGARLRESADQHGEEILERRFDAWAHLLATFRVIYGGLEHDHLSMQARGGGLFNPDRYPFLEGRAARTSWQDTPARPLPIDNRTVLHLLEALQILRVKVPGGGPAEARRLSFRALGVEQIGHVYEKLLDHTAVRAHTVVLGLTGAKDQEPEILLADLEAKRSAGLDVLADWLQERTGRSKSALRKALDQTVPLEDRRLEVACAGTPGLRERVAPYGGLLRTDSFGYPMVVHDHGVFVTTGTDRRTSGTHYTPPSLTEPLVQHALDPLLYQGMADGVPPTRDTLLDPNGILSLRVCDIACGSGAFLVQACRYLADRLVESWAREEERFPGRVLTAPLGRPSAGAVHESPIPTDSEERRALARRIVAERCLYGVDKNPLAVEIAKLSLWLVTLAKDQAFTFLDHAIRSGDSLLGVTSREQVLKFHLDPGRSQYPASYSAELDAVLAEATKLRSEIEAFTGEVIEDVQQKEKLLEQAGKATDDLRLVCDAIVAGNLATAAPGRLDADNRLNTRVSGLMTGSLADKELARERLLERTRELLDTDLPDGDPPRRPFHWLLEFPEVFGASEPEQRGFDAIVGNPPFQGGKRITGALGNVYRDLLVEAVARGRRGHADLAAYFFLRARDLLRSGGQFGLLSTNTIAQGDTREVGLDQLIEAGCTIPRAVPSRKWPGDASLEVAHVWVRRGAWAADFVLDDQPTLGISSFLTLPGAVKGMPYRLAANAGKSFIGSFVLGMGFVLEPEEAQALIIKDPRNRDVLFPYLNGEDLNSRPDQSPSRWVVNFRDWPAEAARQYPECWAIIEQRVRPERQRKNPEGSYVLRNPLPDRYWQYADKRPALYSALEGAAHVLVTSRVSQFLAVARVPNKYVFNERLAVFVQTPFSVLQSSFHERWMLTYGSTLETRPMYTPSDCFETFPFPASLVGLDPVGVRYHDYRESLMLARQEGLTKTYNRFHDPREVSADITRLRALHVEMDQAVAAAYGWTGLDLGHGFHDTKQGVRYTLSESARREVLARLLRLNHERHEAEVKAGLADEKGPISAAIKKANARKPANEDQQTLF